MGPVSLRALCALVIHLVVCNVLISHVLIVSRVHACGCMHVWERLHSIVWYRAVADVHVWHWLIVNIYGEGYVEQLREQRSSRAAGGQQCSRLPS